MKLNYHKQTDSLYIIFKEGPGVDSYEISTDFIADFDTLGQIIGLEVLNVKKHIDLNELIVDKTLFNSVNLVGA
jgi:uncharacterized protein YuzE